MEESTTIGDPLESKFAPIGPRVGGSGHVFETDGCGGRVITLFTWAAELPAQVVRDFTREAMRVADLHHPYVAQVFDAGTLGDGTPFVVMERLAGMTLDEAANGRSLPMAEVLPILRGVGSALCAAHAAGIGHGEVRADNVFITDPASYEPGCPKLLDFGVARLAGGARRIGRGIAELGPRAGEREDQLALAALAWRLLGAMPSPGIQGVLLRAMSADPRQRFGSIKALVEALEQVSLNAATAGLTAKADPVRTLVGATIPVSPSRPALAMVAPPSCLAAAPPVISAPTPELASSPSSLTQQFFSEGERLEMEHTSGRTSDAGAITEGDEGGDLETAAASRVPRSRAQMFAAALLALGSVAGIGWTVVSLASKPSGGPSASDASPAPVVARPVAVSPAGMRRLHAVTDRGPGEKLISGRRAPRVQPLPVAASEVFASSRLATPPTPGEVSPAARMPSIPSGPAPLAAAAAPDEVPAPPPTHAPPAEGAPRTGDQATPLPTVAPAGSSDNDEPQPGQEEGGKESGAIPAPSAPEEPGLAPRSSDDVSAESSAADAPPTALSR
jgi:hypothetical protein